MIPSELSPRGTLDDHTGTVLPRDESTQQPAPRGKLRVWARVTAMVLRLVQVVMCVVQQSSAVARMVGRVTMQRVQGAANLVPGRNARCGNWNSTVHSSITIFGAILTRRYKIIMKGMVMYMDIKMMLQLLKRICIYIVILATITIWILRDIFDKHHSQEPTIQQTSLFLSLNREMRDMIFAKLPMDEVFRIQSVCKDFIGVMKSNTFKSARRNNEGIYGPNVFYLKNDGLNSISWQWMSYDIVSQKWRKMPPFSLLPTPDIELFKDYFVAGGGGLFCIDVGKGSQEEMILYQPLTQQKKILPHLIYRRRPVLMYVLVDLQSSEYKIIVAGSSTLDKKILSKKTEVFDSTTKRWKESDDIPGPYFALNEYQTGVYVQSLNTLFCIGFLPNGEGRGILAYNVSKGKWNTNICCHLPENFLYNETRVPTQISNAQLVEYNDEVYLFSILESDSEVIHSIHKIQNIGEFGALDIDENIIKKDKIIWERLLWQSRNGSRGLLVYPEFVCIAYGKNKFCIFNTVHHCGIVYTIQTENGINTASKEKIHQFPKLKESSLMFYSLNPLDFRFEPNFKVSLE